ncbi:MAG: sulfatase-like hydrolase/transferase [Xanthomonadaceae bacterium]|nr:sulfatase-like hydrolase/transferase [Xanthomonadaceae bacterium]
MLPHFKIARPTLSANRLLSIVALYLVLFANARFWSIALDASAGQGWRAIGVTAAIAAALFSLTLLMLLPMGMRWVLKPGLVLVLLLSAGAAHFIGDFGAVIDRHALASVYETDAREAGEWLSLRMLGTLCLLGMLPALAVCWVKVEWQSFLRETFSRAKLAAGVLLLLGIAALTFGKDVASLVRNHMELRHIANPFALLAAQLSYMDHARNDNRPMERIGIDAKRGTALPAGRRPVVLVLAIGESARAASLDLNGYARATGVPLRDMPIVNFSQVRSCGTNTATSVPCMFSGMGRKDYDDGRVKRRENLLDVVKRGGYDVLWLDNNTGSKGLAKRAKEYHVGKTASAKHCNEEGCFDEALLEHLDKVLPTIQRDTVIVVHLLGSHGPAYYARYPERFAAFKPECRTNELQRCSDQQIRNTYDNTMLYTSYVLAGIARRLGESGGLPESASIACLATKPAGQCPPTPAVSPSAAVPVSPAFDGAMLYVSDHGESLGEHRLYLHGAPYAIAPSEQTHVPMIFWSSETFAARRKLDLACQRRRANAELSHDHFFHSVLGLADVATRERRAELDVFAPCIRRID